MLRYNGRMKLNLYLPGLCWTDADPALYQQLPTPALDLLFRRARHRPLGLDGLTVLADRLGLPLPLPHAALSALGLGLNAEEGYWLHADPVSLQPSRGELILLDSSQFTLASDESDALLAALNTHFADDGLQFVAADATHWFLRLPSAPSMHTTPLLQVLGRDIHPRLPQGEQAMHWHRLLNELQMLLYQHPVNDVRDRQGDPLVHSVWPWGEGALPPTQPSKHPLQLWADAPLWQGIARWQQRPIQPLPTDGTRWLASTPTGEHLLVLPQLQAATAWQDGWQWREGLLQLEQRWFAPLWQALCKGQVQQLNLLWEGPQGLVGSSLTPAVRGRFWQRSRPWHQLRITLEHATALAPALALDWH